MTSYVNFLVSFPFAEDILVALMLVSVACYHYLETYSISYGFPK